MLKAKVRKAGEFSGVILPDEVVSRLKIKEGDELAFTESRDGSIVSKNDADLEESMKLAEEISDQFQSAFRELTKR